MSTHPAPLLPPTSDDTRLVEAVVLQEAARGEQLVGKLRAALFTLVGGAGGVTMLMIGEQPGLLGTLRSAGPFVAPVILTLIWAVAYWVHKRPYQQWFSYATVVLDVSIIVCISFALVLVGGVDGATATSMGGTPPMLILFFYVAAAGVRQTPLASALAGALAVVGYLGVVVLAQSRHDVSMVDATLHFLMTPQAWGARIAILAFTALLVTLSSVNARRMARATGAAVADQLKVMSIFGRYVDPEVARDAIQGGGVRAETREVTVLFTDLRDFTALSEKLSPVDLLEALNAHYSAIVPVVQRHGGTVNKFVGDAIMATFGAPLKQDDHARRAAVAAGEMLKAMAELNEHFKAQGKAELKMGIGIASGPVVVGSLGAANRVEYAVLGDTVNTAARLEGLNKELRTEVLLSAATHKLIDGAVGTRALGQVPVRGKAQPVEVFTLA